MIASRTLRDTFSEPTLARKADLLEQCEAALPNADTVRRYHVPGRIEVLGKHTDYAGGLSVVVATENGIIMAASPRNDRVMRLATMETGATIECELSPELQPTQGSWANYPTTVARRVARNFPGAMKGADIILASDLPPAAGLSSSSALMIAIFLALADINDLYNRPEFRRNISTIEDLAGYLGTNENGQTFGDLAGDRGVGTFGGSQDHTAILGSEPDHLHIYKYCPVKLRRSIPLPPSWVFAVASSGVVAEKTRGAMEKYNLASRRVSEILEIWRTKTGRTDATLNDAVHSSPDAPQRLRVLLPSQELLNRFDQFYAESEEIIPQAADAFADADAKSLGPLVDRSQAFAESKLGNQTPETMLLAKSARDNGAIAASAFGAGFGGSVWALIDQAQADSFLDKWRKSYHAAAPAVAAHSTFFTTRAGSAACRII